MAILSGCCCRYSLRQGSYFSAIYTLVYFILFALLTGNVSYDEVMGTYRPYPDPLPSNLTNANITTNNTTNATNQSVEAEVDHRDRATTSDILLIFVDFVCEICGGIASVVLLRGLSQDKRLLLIPWLIIVPLHTVIDTFTVINIIYMYATDEHDGSSGLVTFVTVTLDFILNFINVYAFLCVLSQYQDLSAGRGTAAYYAAVRWQRPSCSVRYETSRANPEVITNGRRVNGTNPCFSEGEKSDIWVGDLLMDKLDSGAQDSWSRGKGSNRGRKTSNTTTTVRFDCDEESVSAAPMSVIVKQGQGPSRSDDKPN